MTTSRVGRVRVQNLWPETDALTFDTGDGITLTVSQDEHGVCTVYVQDDLEGARLYYTVGDNEVLDPETGEYSIQSDGYPFFEGAHVVATEDITEENLPGCLGTHVHAHLGDLGVVELIDAGNHCLPTVRFYKSGTATVVAEGQIELAED